MAYFNRTGQPNIRMTITPNSAMQRYGKGVVPTGASDRQVEPRRPKPGRPARGEKGRVYGDCPDHQNAAGEFCTTQDGQCGKYCLHQRDFGEILQCKCICCNDGSEWGLNTGLKCDHPLGDEDTCNANLTGVRNGYAPVTVTNPDGKKSARTRAFSIR